jgi:hypothetical protein
MSNITDKVVRIVLVFSITLAIFQLPPHAQGKDPNQVSAHWTVRAL